MSLGAILLALLATTTAALPLARILDRRASALTLAGESILLGCGLVAVILFLSSLAGVPWSLTGVALPLLLVSAAAFFFGGRVDADAREVATTARPLLAATLVALALLLLAGYSLFATFASPWEWDYWAIWGLKGRVFYLHRGIDTEFLARQWNTFVHPDYPPLLPLVYSFLALAAGGWNDRWFGIVGPLFAGATMLVIYPTMRQLGRSSLLASCALLAASSLVMSKWIGMAEAPLIAFSTAGLLLTRRDLERDDPQPVGPLLLGLAAFTKNEGVSLLIAASAALLVARPGDLRWALRRLWPAWMIAIPWQIYTRMMLRLSTDVFEGPVATRVVDRGKAVGAVAQALARHPLENGVFWIATVFVLILGWRNARRERFLLVTLILQLSFFLAVYLVTPHDIEWHVANSWQRIVGGLGGLAACLGFLVVAAELQPAQTVVEGSEFDASR